MTTVTTTGVIGADNQIDNISDLSTWAIFGAQPATSFGIELALENRITFHGSGFGAYSGNMPTTGTINSLVIYDIVGATVYQRETWSGFSLAVSDFLIWIGNNDVTALQNAIFGGADTITDAPAQNDFLFGYGGDDTITATFGSDIDTFDGGAGTDTLVSKGNQTFTSDTLTSFERLQFALNGSEITLAAQFLGSQIGPGLSTTLQVVGSSAIDIVSIGVASGNLDLSGWTFSTWGPNDGINIAANLGANTLIGTSRNDSISGGVGADDLRGGAGNDQLYASAGAVADGATDHMYGGVGNDQYGVFEAGDIIHENVGAGVDYAAVYINYTMAANLDNMAMYGAALIATGNALNNGITGNALNNALLGMAGNDALFGDAGNDTLRGGAGADTLDGGANIDTASYSTSGARVQVNLTTNSGLDGDALGDSFNSIENLAGSAFNDLLTGDTGANTLSGDNGADTLRGGGGADKLNGGTGLDILTGGGGADTFVFNTAPAAANRDTITDYSVADTIQIENAVFVGIGATLGVLAAAKFHIGAAAADASDRIIYNAATGVLYFDADGNGAGLTIQFVTLTAGLALTAADFVVI